MTGYYTTLGIEHLLPCGCTHLINGDSVTVRANPFCTQTRVLKLDRIAIKEAKKEIENNGLSHYARNKRSY